MAQLPSDYSEKPIKNKFRCSECKNIHDITDLFVWSGCQHKYGRGCVTFCIKTQLYGKKLPICIVNNCNKLLHEDAAQLVLPHDVLIDFYQTHNDHQPPQNQTKHINIDDEKHSGSQYVSLKQSNDTDSSSDGINNVINGTQIPFSINADPDDDSSDALITYDKTEEEPLLNNGHFNHTYGINNNKPTSFECILCKKMHISDERFEWTNCKHLYGRQCAENMIIEWLFKPDIPKCIICNQWLQLYEAINLLHFDELQIFKEIYALKESLESFNAQQQDQNQNEKDPPVNSTQNTPNQDGIANDTQSKSIASVSDQIEKDIKKDIKIEAKEVIKNEIQSNENINDNNNKNKLAPSILMLPDNNYQALIPMDDDFIDSNGIVLNAQKQAELQNQNLFYCSRCKKLISLSDDIHNGKYIPIKCKHGSCKECAKKHTKHEMEILKTIPTCQICAKTILDNDLIEIWGKYEANQLMDALFKERSLKLPPAEPALAALAAAGLTAAGAGDVSGDVSSDINDRDNVASPIVNEVNDNVLEEKAKEKEKREEDGYGHCLTDGCHKKGLLSQEKNEEWRLDCVYCGNIWCIKCGIEWHLGQTCEQYRNEFGNEFGNVYDYNDEINFALQQQANMKFDEYDDILNGYYDKNNEQEFQEMYKQENWRTCPLCCATYEKDGGCNRMKCKCGISFCWMCEQIVDANGNDKHYEKGMCALNDDQHK